MFSVLSYLALRQTDREETTGIHRSGLTVLIGAVVPVHRKRTKNLQNILPLALFQPISITDLQIAS